MPTNRAIKLIPYRSRESCKALRWDGHSYKGLLDLELPVVYNRETHELVIRGGFRSSEVDDSLGLCRSVAKPGDMLVVDRYGKLYASTPEVFGMLWYRAGGPR